MTQGHILPEDTKRTRGKEAQRNNILAARMVADTVRTTLGPKGMDKMLVDPAGDVVVTNDGVTILQEAHVEHPAAKMVVEIAKTQEDVVGDGTTTAVVLAGELLKQAEGLLDQEVHPTILINGYRLAQQKAQTFLAATAKTITAQDTSTLLNIAQTAMTGKGAEGNKEQLAQLVLDAALAVAQGTTINKKHISVKEYPQKLVSQSTLVAGVVLDKERVHPTMPKQVKDTKIALLDCPLELKSTEIDAKIQLTNPTQLQAYLDQEEQQLKAMVDHIIASGATVVFCQKGIDDLAQHFLSKAGILAARRVRRSDLEQLARATGARIIGQWKELGQEHLGKAGYVHQQRVGADEMLFIEKCAHPKAVTLLIGGSTSHVIAETVRAVTDALGVVAAVIEDTKIVPGAGAIEIALSQHLRSYATTLKGREQLAVEAFARALEVVPRTLAENAGLDTIDMLAKLRSVHEQEGNSFGVNVFTGDVLDAFTEGIVEPLRVKTQALESAAQVAEMILRIDDMILARREEGMHHGPPSQGM